MGRRRSLFGVSIVNSFISPKWNLLRLPFLCCAAKVTNKFGGFPVFSSSSSRQMWNTLWTSVVTISDHAFHSNLQMLNPIQLCNRMDSLVVSSLSWPTKSYDDNTTLQTATVSTADCTSHETAATAVIATCRREDC